MPRKSLTHCGIVLVFICCATRMTLGRKAYSGFYCRKVFTDFEKKYVSKYVIQISEDKFSVDVKFDLIKRLDVDVWLKLVIAQRKAKNTYRVIFAYDVNLCSLLGKGSSINLLQHWINTAYRYTNLPKQCPVEAGEYYWANLHPDGDSIPRFLLSGNFRIDSLIYMKDWNNDMLTNTTMFVDIKMKSA